MATSKDDEYGVRAFSFDDYQMTDLGMEEVKGMVDWPQESTDHQFFVMSGPSGYNRRQQYKEFVHFAKGRSKSVLIISFEVSMSTSVGVDFIQRLQDRVIIDDCPRYLLSPPDHLWKLGNNLFDYIIIDQFAHIQSFVKSLADGSMAGQGGRYSKCWPNFLTQIRESAFVFLCHEDEKNITCADVAYYLHNYTEGSSLDDYSKNATVGSLLFTRECDHFCSCLHKKKHDKSIKTDPQEVTSPNLVTCFSAAEGEALVGEKVKKKEADYDQKGKRGGEPCESSINKRRL